MTTDVLTIGSFDLLHAGHVQMLNRCEHLGTVTVGVNTDRFIEQYKGRPPVQTTEEREHAIRALGFRTIENDGPGRDLIEATRPRILAIGPDWLERDYLAQIDVTADELFGWDVVLAFVPPPRVAGLSSTAIREAMA